MSDTAGIVLAGGRSSRMGMPKAALEWHGSTLLRRAAGILARVADGPVVVVRAPGQTLPELPPAVEVVDDPREGLGPVQGLAAGLAAVADRAEIAFVCSTDLPFLHPAFARRVLRAVAHGVDVALPVTGGYPQPLAAAYRTALAPVAERLVREQRLRLAFLADECTVARLDDAALRADPMLAALDPGLDSVLNVNEPADYQAARARPAPEVTVQRFGALADGHRGPQPARAATVAGAAAAAGLALDGHVVAALNGGQITRDGEMPLAAGDTVFFLAATRRDAAALDGLIPVRPHLRDTAALQGLLPGPAVIGAEHGGYSPGMKREFSAMRTPAQALTDFRPGRRTRAETIPLTDALHRIPAAPVTSAHPLPGFERSAVDGFAVRAADTSGVSDGLPGYLDVAGAVRMGAAPDVAVSPGTAVAIPAGGVLPPGADAVVMTEDAADAMSGTIGVARRVSPGEGVHWADEDAAPGAAIAPAGRPLRAQDLGMLAAAGVTSVTVHARPVVTVFSAGDEVVPPDTAALMPGQVRDATSVTLAALIADAGGDPVSGGIVADDPGLLEAALRPAMHGSDLIVVSAGSSVGARDVAAAVSRLGEPGVWCQSLAIEPGKLTLLAECAGVPVIGLPGDPRSALVVFRLIGMPLVRLVGGCILPPAEATVRARLDRDLTSATGRLDVVQVRVSDGWASPVLGTSALLSVLTAADGYVIIPETAAGVGAGLEVGVTLYR